MFQQIPVSMNLQSVTQDQPRKFRLNKFYRQTAGHQSERVDKLTSNTTIRARQPTSRILRYLLTSSMNGSMLSNPLTRHHSRRIMKTLPPGKQTMYTKYITFIASILALKRVNASRWDLSSHRCQTHQLFMKLIYATHSQVAI